MTNYHPIYGELLTSRQVADQTGFTLNQLRNQRARPETSAFNWIRQGGNPCYRKDDIEVWLEQNGSMDAEYVQVPNAIAAPLHSFSTDIKHRGHLSDLAKITTSNAWGSHGTWLLEQSGLREPYKRVDEWAEELWNKHRAITPEAEEFMPLNFSRLDLVTQYWPATVWAVRRATAFIRGWEVTDEEIMAMPVGSVPPNKQN